MLNEIEGVVGSTKVEDGKDKGSLRVTLLVDPDEDFDEPDRSGVDPLFRQRALRYGRLMARTAGKHGWLLHPTSWERADWGDLSGCAAVWSLKYLGSNPS